MKENDQLHFSEDSEGLDIPSVSGSLQDITAGRDFIRVDGTNQIGEPYTEISGVDGGCYASGDYSRTKLPDGTIVENDSQGTIIYYVDGRKTVMNPDGSNVYISPSGEVTNQTPQEVQDVIDGQGGVVKILGLDDLGATS